MNNYLKHHGIPGMKWGVRNYQYSDGTLTEEGKRRYGKSVSYNKFQNEKKTSYATNNKEQLKKYAKIGAISIGAALAAYGTYKLYKVANKKDILNNEQIYYLYKNIQNIPKHTDDTKKILNSSRYQHALSATLKSRMSSIKGDRALFGSNSVKGRDAYKEAKNFVDNAKFYHIHRNNMYGWN